MAFTKGHKLSQGRKAGSKNRTQHEIKEIIKGLLSCQVERLGDDLNRLSPDLRLKYTIQLLKFIIPTQKELDLRTDSQFQPIEIKLISNEDK